MDAVTDSHYFKKHLQWKNLEDLKPLTRLGIPIYEKYTSLHELHRDRSQFLAVCSFLFKWGTHAAGMRFVMERVQAVHKIGFGSPSSVLPY